MLIFINTSFVSFPIGTIRMRYLMEGEGEGEGEGGGRNRMTYRNKGSFVCASSSLR